MCECGCGGSADVPNAILKCPRGDLHTRWEKNFPNSLSMIRLRKYLGRIFEKLCESGTVFFLSIISIFVFSCKSENPTKVLPIDQCIVFSKLKSLLI